MPTIVEVSDLLRSRQLRDAEFPFLSREPSSVHMLLLQPTGVIVADDETVTVEDVALLGQQLSQFLLAAQECGADLAACPEYCCPWEALIGAVTSGILPAEGKLWALGCSGISLARLDAAIARLDEDCTVIFRRPRETEKPGFLDCLCYVFRARSEADELVTVVLVQAKTHQMGDHPYEYERLICGDVFYRFGKPGHNRLVTFLCSDVLGPSFRAQVVPQIAHQTLVVHLQLNPSPANHSYRAYREDCCRESPRNTEVLCLNWASGTEIFDEGTRKLFIPAANSALYRTAQEVDDDESRIAANHANGCYLSYWEPHRTAVFSFCGDPLVLHCQTTKPYVQANAANALRFGPRMMRRLRWGGGRWSADTNPHDDGFDSYWSCNLVRPLIAPYSAARVDAERLIQFSTGRALSSRWSHWQELTSFRVEDDDSSCRLSLCWSQSGRGFEYREACRSDFQGFAHVVANPHLFSSRLAAFKNGGLRVEYKSSPMFYQFCNLHIDDRHGTAVYLGSAPSETRLTATHRELSRRLHDLGRDVHSLAIWYRQPDGELKDFMEMLVPSFADDPAADPASISTTQYER